MKYDKISKSTEKTYFPIGSIPGVCQCRQTGQAVSAGWRLSPQLSQIQASAQPCRVWVGGESAPRGH